MQKIIQNLAFSAAVVLIGSLPVQAQNIGGLGVQYDRMPVGTKVFYKTNKGQSWTDVFIGKKKDKYIIHRYNGKRIRGRAQSKRAFDVNGRLISYTGYGDRAHEYRISFIPYLCEFQLGNCKTKRRFRGDSYIADGSSESWGATTKKVPGGYQTLYSKPRTGALFGATFFKLGKYNLRSIAEWGSGKNKTTTKIISIK